MIKITFNCIHVGAPHLDLWHKFSAILYASVQNIAEHFSMSGCGTSGKKSATVAIKSRRLAGLINCHMMLMKWFLILII